MDPNKVSSTADMFSPKKHGPFHCFQRSFYGNNSKILEDEFLFSYGNLLKFENVICF